MIKLRIILHLLSLAINIALCIFIWSKGFKKRINFFIGLTAMFSGLYSLANALFLWQKTPLSLAICWIGLFILPSYGGVSLCLRNRIPNFKNLYHLFLLGMILFILFLTPLFTTTVQYSNQVLTLNRGMLEKIGRLFINYSLIYALYHMFAAYKESREVKRRQLKYFIVGSVLYTLGGIIYVGILPLIQKVFYDDIPGILSFIWVGFSVYAIIRYRAMEIDTVIHKTLLWVGSIALLILPAATVEAVVFKRWFIQANYALTITLLSGFILFIISYYNRLRPRIDHLFRRRKYAYHEVLGKVSEKIATIIDIEDLTRQFLTEVCEALYLYNSILYILARDEKSYFLTGRRGYKEVDGARQPTALEIYTEEERTKLPHELREFNYNHPLCRWIIQHQDILEKDQIEIDPQYQGIRQEALNWFQKQELELIVPLVFENNVTAILGLGRKESLQAYTLKDIELLKKLGQEAGVTVFNAIHHEDLLEKKRLEDEMRLGREIQMELLPKENPRTAGLNLCGLMLPAKEIGGDYYDFVELPQDNLAIVIGDVSGKGVAAGLLMAMAKTAIHTLSQEETSPRQVLLRTNQILSKHIGGQKFMTMLYLKWETLGKELTYSSAGHEHILIYRAKDNIVESIQSGGFMLGIIPDISQFLEDNRLYLAPKDKIVLYTDGVTEARNPNEELFSLGRLKGLLSEHGHKPADELLNSIKDEVYSFMGIREQYDDITLVVLEAV